jgi:hypothetical protein
MLRVWLVAIMVLGACNEPLILERKKPRPTRSSHPQAESSPTQPATPQPPPQPQPSDPGAALVQPTPEPPAPEPITEFEMDSPMSMTIAGDTLMWTDPAGSLWSMPSHGGKQIELSHQHLPDRPMYMNLAAHAGDVIASRRGDLARVKPPDGPVVPLGLDLGDDSLLELVSDGTAMYATSFLNRSAIYKIVDGKKTKLLDLRSASIAVVGDTLYAVSYSSGQLVAIKTSGGAPRTIARGLAKTTGFAVDAKAAYVWGEKDSALKRVDLKTGKVKVLLDKDLSNCDILAVDGDWVYAHSWLGEGASTFVRVATDGSQVQVLANDLTAPYDVAIDDEAVFVSDRDQNKIIRFDKRAIKPL